jgi:hypothetical protein
MAFTEKLKRWINPDGQASSRKQMLRLVLLGSLMLHLLAGLIFGGIVLISTLTREETVFEAPPPMRTYEPRKVELKVKVQQKQRSSSRPQVVPRLISSRPSAITLPDIKVDPKLVTTTFQPKFKAVTGVGMGVGLGTGYGTSGFGQGVSKVNFFGIQAVGERIAVCVDVSVSMVEEGRGGPTGFFRVKERVNAVIDALKEGTLFNVIVFADGCSIMETEKMLYANPESRTKAKQFLAPYNTEGQWGHDGGNFGEFPNGLKAEGGTTRLDLAISAAMSQGADTILVISDGLPQVKKPLTAEQIEAHHKRVAAWQAANAAKVAAANAAYDNAPLRREWVPPQPARPPSKGPFREGQTPDPGAPAQDGYWREVRDVPPAPKPPPMPDPGMWTLADFVQHIELIYKDIYVAKGLKAPTIHCIGYQIDKDGHEFLKKLTKQYKGQFRLVQRLR